MRLNKQAGVVSIRIIKPGLQTTVQAGPRVGRRHLGVPASGAADPLSLALANRLVGNDLLAPALEVTLSGLSLSFESTVQFALTGATAKVELNGAEVTFHTTLSAGAGDELQLAPPAIGARVYVAFSGGLAAENILGSTSTYLPAALGGHEGRALRADDRLSIDAIGERNAPMQTPQEFRPLMSRSWALRACHAGETSQLINFNSVFDTNFTVGNRADRMGMMLEGAKVDIKSAGRMPSAPVFPGTVQCPEDGTPFLLSVDAQTTGGYPRILQVARVDRHLLGQIRPGDRVRFLPRDEDTAIEELRAKIAYWDAWLKHAGQVV